MNVGDKINHLTMVSEPFSIKNRKHAIFKCDCGTEKTMQIRSVKNGSSKSCGCWHREIVSNYAKNRPHHGLTKHPLYKSWYGMKSRCNNKNIEDYLNGISYCKEWEKFETFYEWAIQCWSEGLVFTRINNQLDFYPENCHFVKRELTSNFMFQSLPEKETLKFVNSFGYEFSSNWEILNGKQLDMYCDELKLAFEFNGTYYHSDAKKDKFYHYDKFMNCLRQNICLVFIWGDDWTFKNDYCKSLIKSVITKSKHPLDASTIIENGTGLELFIKKEIDKILDPDYWLLDRSKRINKEEAKNDRQYHKVWNAGYTIFKE